MPMDKSIAIKLSLFAFVLLAISACEKTPRTVGDLSHKIRTVTYSIEDKNKITRIELDGEFGLTRHIISSQRRKRYIRY